MTKRKAILKTVLRNENLVFSLVKYYFLTSGIFFNTNKAPTVLYMSPLTHITLFFGKHGKSPLYAHYQMLLIRFVDKSNLPSVFFSGVPFQGKRNTKACLRIRILQKSHLSVDSNFQSGHSLRGTDMNFPSWFGCVFLFLVIFIFPL